MVKFVVILICTVRRFTSFSIMGNAFRSTFGKVLKMFWKCFGNVLQGRWMQSRCRWLQSRWWSLNYGMKEWLHTHESKIPVWLFMVDCPLWSISLEIEKSVSAEWQQGQQPQFRTQHNRTWWFNFWSIYLGRGFDWIRGEDQHYGVVLKEAHDLDHDQGARARARYMYMYICI